MLVSKLETIEGYAVGILKYLAIDMVESIEECDILRILGGTNMAQDKVLVMKQWETCYDMKIDAN